MTFFNIIFSNTFDKEQRREIGRKSDRLRGCDTLGTGHTLAALKQVGKRHSLKLLLNKDETA